MANEITTTTLDDLTNATLVEPVVILALSEQPGIAIRVCREFNAINKPTAALKIPTQTNYWDTPNDRGAGVATAFNGTEANALGNTAVSTGNSTITAAEYGVAHSLTDNVGEDSVFDALELMNLFTTQDLKVLTLALDDDYVALYSSISNVVGTTNTTLTIANMILAVSGIRQRGTVADQLMYVLDNKQAQDLESAIIAGSTSMAVYAMAADRLIGYGPTNDNGLSSSRTVMGFHGYPVVATGLTDNANGVTDVVGACICPSTAMNDASGATTHGLMWKRLPKFETQRQVKGRSTDLVMTMRAGVAELQDGSGTQILSKA